jgi:hypothetical protein
MLRDYNRVHAAAGGKIDPTGEYFESLLPKKIQIWLYRFALGRGFYDAILDRFIIAPVMAVARFLAIFDPDISPPKVEPVTQPTTLKN